VTPRYALDTDILSNVTKTVPSPAVLRWLESQDPGTLFVATFTLAEIERGIFQCPAGKKRTALEAWFYGADGPRQILAGRILPFDQFAATHWARIMAEGATGRPRSATDMIVAATAAANDCVVVTLNERHFRGAVPLINPLTAS